MQTQFCNLEKCVCNLFLKHSTYGNPLFPPSFSRQKPHSRGDEASSRVFMKDWHFWLITKNTINRRRAGNQNKGKMSLSLPYFCQERSPKGDKDPLHSCSHYHKLSVEWSSASDEVHFQPCWFPSLFSVSIFSVLIATIWGTPSLVEGNEVFSTFGDSQESWAESH